MNTNDRQNHLDISLTDAELNRVSECASKERMSPNSWVRLVADDIARRVLQVHTPDPKK